MKRDSGDERRGIGSALFAEAEIEDTGKALSGVKRGEDEGNFETEKGAMVCDRIAGESGLNEGA
jgi:hypothetical protein